MDISPNSHMDSYHLECMMNDASSSSLSNVLWELDDQSALATVHAADVFLSSANCSTNDLDMYDPCALLENNEVMNSTEFDGITKLQFDELGSMFGFSENHSSLDMSLKNDKTGSLLEENLSS